MKQGFSALNVRWVEERNPTSAKAALGEAKRNPTYKFRLDALLRDSLNPLPHINEIRMKNRCKLAFSVHRGK
jgi:hypothetical protein